jgi:HemK-like putative methylase
MAHVDFAEIDMSHHPTIQKNINYNIPGRQAHIFGGTLFAQVQEKYDYILTNPPYIDPVLNRAETSVTQYEPAQALYGGTDGLEYIRNIIAQASSFLNKGGTLIIEHEPEHVTEISSHAEEYGFAIQTLKDQYNVARFTSLTRKAKALVSQ